MHYASDCCRCGCKAWLRILASCSKGDTWGPVAAVPERLAWGAGGCCCHLPLHSFARNAHDGVTYVRTTQNCLDDRVIEFEVRTAAEGICRVAACGRLRLGRGKGESKSSEKRSCEETHVFRSGRKTDELEKGLNERKVRKVNVVCTPSVRWEEEYIRASVVHN